MFAKLSFTLAVILSVVKAQDRMIRDSTCTEVEKCLDDFWYFNKLACQCFRALSCDDDCPPGMRDSPVTDCECWEEDEIRTLFPDWASEKQILASYDFGMPDLFVDQDFEFDISEVESLGPDLRPEPSVD